MKITEERTSRPEHKRRAASVSVKEKAIFPALIRDSQTQMHTEELERLYETIDQLGGQLGKSQTLVDFYRFKQQVQRFIKEAVSFGLHLRQSCDWRRPSGTKTFRLVEEIDKRLIEMTEQLLKKENKAVNLLDKIGEIKGILINLYR